MKALRIIQAVVLMSVVVVGVSCAASKDYTSKLFEPRTPTVKDSQAVAIRFLELDKIDGDKEDWVTTDIIMGRDTVSKTVLLDNLAKVFPAAPVKSDSITYNEQEKTIQVLADTKHVIQKAEPVAKNSNPGEVRNKKTRE